MELVELYKSILASLNVFVADDGSCFLDYGDGKQHPVVIDGKTMVLPTREVLNRGLGDTRIGFHPLSENIQRGESPVIRKTKILVAARVTQVISDLFETFVGLAANPKLHAKLSPSQKELLQALPDADERSVNDLDKIYAAMSDDAKRKLVSIYLRRGGTLRLEKFARVAVIRFPILSEFENEDRTVFGVKLRKADYVGFPKLFEFMLPSSDGDSGYSYGSNDMYAPYLDALLNAFWLVADRLNKMVDMFKKHLPNADRLRIDLSWAEAMKENGWAKYRDQIPALEGNEGTTANEEAAETPTAVAPTPIHRAYDPAKAAAAAVSVRGPAPPAAPSPAAETKTAEVRSGSGGLNWDDIVAAQARRSLPGTVTYPTVAPGVSGQPGVAYPVAGAVQPAYMGPPPPGFGQPPGPPPTDAWGRPLPGVVQPGTVAGGYPPPGFVAPPPGYGQPPPPGFGPAPGQPTPGFDAYGRPMVMAPPPGGAPGHPGGRQPTFGPYAAPPGPQPGQSTVMVDQWGRPMMPMQPAGYPVAGGYPMAGGYPPPGMMTAAPPGQAGVMMYPPGYMQPPPGFGPAPGGGMFGGNAAAVPVYSR